MTFICTTFNRVRQRLGTLYGNGTLDSQATGVNAYGTITVTLPAQPGANQSVTINNTGSGTVTVSGNGNLIGASASVTIAAGASATFYNAGYDASSYPVTVSPRWIVVNAGCSYTLPADQEHGTSTTGPYATQPSLPDNVILTRDVAEFCGGTIQHTVTVEYALVHYAATDANAGFYGTDWFGANNQLFASAAAAWQRWFDSIPNDPAYNGWNTCPVINNGTFVSYWYGEPTYVYNPTTNNVTVSDSRMRNALSGDDLSCTVINNRVSVPFVCTYSASTSQIGFTAAEVWYIVATVTGSYTIV